MGRIVKSSKPAFDNGIPAPEPHMLPQIMHIGSKRDFWFNKYSCQSFTPLLVAVGTRLAQQTHLRIFYSAPWRRRRRFELRQASGFHSAVGRRWRKFWLKKCTWGRSIPFLGRHGRPNCRVGNAFGSLRLHFGTPPAQVSVKETLTGPFHAILGRRKRNL